jgi:hypothetical protein
MMQTCAAAVDTERYARCIAASKRIRWDIDADVIRGRSFKFENKFLPDGLSLVDRLDFLSAEEKRYLSQIQGRTYANVFGLVERFINAKVLEVSRDHWLGDQMALEALIRFSDEEIKHQELFRRLEHLAAESMPPGYSFVPEPNDVARAVLSKSTWAVFALILHIELFTQSHYRESIDSDNNLSPLFKDVFLFHWREESQHAIVDELEWRRHDATVAADERDRGVDEFIELIGSVDQILQAQAASDTRYFAATCGRVLNNDEMRALAEGVLRAYRWQYILTGAKHPHFRKVLGELIDEKQAQRIQSALVSLY